MQNNKIEKDISEIKELLKDLVLLNSYFTHELIRITENTKTIADSKKPKAKCQNEHSKIQKIAMSIAEKWNPKKVKEMKKHILGHR